jgi:thiol:disulfide interchange protein DsbC
MKLILRLTILLALVLSISACGSAPTKEKVTTGIKKIMPVNFEVVEINKVPEVPGIYEIVIKIDKQHVVFYMDGKGQYVISGSIVDTATNKNLTVEKQKKYLPAQPAGPQAAAPAPAKEQKK